MADPTAWWHDANWLSASAAVGQVVTGVVALHLAWRSNKLSRQSHFFAHILSDLFDLRLKGARVEKLYRQLLGPHWSEDAKRAVRTEWAQTREDVAERLTLLADAFPEAEQARKAWDALVEQEDSHANNDSPLPVMSEHAVRRYTELSNEFCGALNAAIRDLRG